MLYELITGTYAVTTIIMMFVSGLTFLSFLLASRAEMKSTPNDGMEACPTWYVFNNITGRCSCIELEGEIICDKEFNGVHIANSLCMTYDNDTGETTVGKCPYMMLSRQHEGLLESGFIDLPENISELNEFMCGPFNRMGYLCHKCKPGYGITIANVFQNCVKCNYSKGEGWLLYFMLQLIPLTVLFLVILLFRISLVRPPMRAFVPFYQASVAVIFTHTHRFYPPYVTSNLALRSTHYLYVVFFGMWGVSLTENVFGITDFCVSENINMQQAFTLKQVQSVFPLLLVAFTYACIQLYARNCKVLVWLWKPFRRCFTNVHQEIPKLSLVDVFSTLLLLSFSRYNIQLYFLLSGQQVYSIPDNEWKLVLLYNPSVTYFNPTHHLPYSFVLLFIYVIVTVPPILVLILYQTSTCQRVLTCLRLNSIPAVHIFVDLFHGCYKDGSNGSYDLRFTASLYLIETVVAVFIYVGCTFSTYENCAAMSMFLVSFLAFLYFSLVRPYKNQWMNVLDSLLLASLTIINFLLASMSHNSQHKSFNLFVLITVLIIIAIPHVVLFGYMLHMMLNSVYKLRCFQKFIIYCWSDSNVKRRKLNHLSGFNR